MGFGKGGGGGEEWSSGELETRVGLDGKGSAEYRRRSRSEDKRRVNGRRSEIESESEGKDPSDKDDMRKKPHDEQGEQSKN